MGTDEFNLQAFTGALPETRRKLGGRMLKVLLEITQIKGELFRVGNASSYSEQQMINNPVEGNEDP